MPGRMESMENLVEAAEPGSKSRGWFSTLPTAPWKSLRDSHSSTAPTTTILSYEQETQGGHFYRATEGDISIGR